MGVLEEDSFLSDDSSFYGDDDMKEELEARMNAFDVRAWWQSKLPSLTEQAWANMAKKTVPDKATLHNPYEGTRSARQLNERVDEFLERLPPATTKSSDVGTWIYIANPFISRRRKGPVQSIEAMAAGEDPAEDGDDKSQFVVLGGNLLEELSGAKFMIEREMSGQPALKMAKAISKEKDETVKKIKELAMDLKLLSGKWLLFCTESEVNDVWSIVAHNTATGELGMAAKVASWNVESDDRTSRVICVYTKDFTDLDDVGRVLRKLRDLGLVTARGRAIYYKCDAYTHLGIKRDNEYGIRPWVYNSTDMLKESGMDVFFKRKQRV